MAITPQSIAALTTLRTCLPKATAVLNLDFGESFSHWLRTLDRKLLPRLDPEFPLVAAICGGGSTGKSSLFNRLVGTAVSPTGGRAGINRRVLIAVGGTLQNQPGLMSQLGETFGAAPEALTGQQQLLMPGDPLYYTGSNLSAKVVLLDTPDIDTGAQGIYTNRDMARQCLEVSDIFIYIFTNATYNNRDNTDFIARMLTGMGMRPCYLVYRVYPSFSDEQVRSHAMTVAINIYGHGRPAAENVLGIFRADEDNAVAAGERGMVLNPVSGVRHTLAEALDGLDPAPVRTRLLEAMFDDAVHQGAIMGAQVGALKSQLDRYARALELAQEHSVQTALAHFPADQVLRRFARLWSQSDPTVIKFMRRTGRVIEWPLQTVVKTVRRFKKAEPDPKPPSGEADIEQRLEMDLLTSANQLYQKCLESRLIVGTDSVASPAIVQPVRSELEQAPWQPVLESILARKKEVLSWSNQLDTELRDLADQLRSRMGILGRVRQTFAALLNVIPATAAITYILHTGDPVGAAGIKVKLTGIFGLNDLYALIAIPATAGMSKADRKQLEQLLAPLARTWLSHKRNVVRELFESHITGRIFEKLRSAQQQSTELMQEIEQALETL